MEIDQFGLIGNEVIAGCSRCIAHGGFTVYWEGLVYVDGLSGQDESVIHFIDNLRINSLDQALVSLKGCFFMIVEKYGESKYVFTDNSGMFAAYASDSAAGRSYLGLVQSLGLRWSDIDPIAMAEFIQIGTIYFRDTHFPQIRKIGFDEIREYRPDGSVLTTRKEVPVITDPPEHTDLLSSFKGYAKAIENIKTSVDVTGGYDTRTLIAALYANGADFETSVSGFEGHPDLVLGEKVANAIGKKFYYTSHRVDSLESDLDHTVLSLDGLKCSIITQHRLNQYQVDRYARGVELTLKGMGGELYRDYIWLQDFPFYRSSKTNIKKLHRTRIEMMQVPDSIFHSDFRQHSHIAREQRLQRLEEYTLPINTQSYDNLHHKEFLQSSASYFITSAAKGSTISQAPLSEIYRLQHPFHAARSARLAARYQKAFITQCSRALAKVPTTYGTTTSSDLIDIPFDLAGFTLSSSKKLIRKLGQVYFNKTIFVDKPADHPDATAMLLNSEFAKRAIQALKDRSVLDRSVELENIPARFKSSCIVAGWLSDRLD